MHPYVLVGLSSRRYALPVADVVETMRALPVEPLPGAPECVRGLAVIRGAPVPVLDLGKLLGVPPARGGRFVTLRVSSRQVAVEVDEVVGVRTLPDRTVDALPPLLKDAGRDAVTAVGTLDARLLVVLEASRLLPEDAWAALERV